MSTNSFKRFTAKARQSFSGLRPFFLDGHDAANETRDSPFQDDKENDSPDIEEFGYNRTPNTSSAVSDVDGSSPVKDTPSRRKRLIGTLRSMSSLRSLRSRSSREKVKPRLECEDEPESPRPRPRTPTRVPQIRPSLTLNFEQSPPDKPMFDLTKRERSVSSSSSLIVHHSSPVPIPSPAQQESLRMRVMSMRPCELPTGTVPKSPTPLQLILNNEPNKGEVAQACSAPDQTSEPIEPLPTPMPGTNFGFSEKDLAGHPPTYFELPAFVESNDKEDVNLRQDTQQLAGVGAVHDAFTPSSTTNGNGMVLAALDEVEKARLHRRRTLSKSESAFEADINSHCIQHLRAPDSPSDSIFGGEDLKRAISADQASSPIDIEHVVFDDYCEVTASDYQPMCDPTEAHGRMDLQKQAHPGASEFPRLATENKNPHHAPNAWGTHGSLYDGTGYGDSSSSISPRPSTSYTALNSAMYMGGSTMYSIDPLAEDSDVMARDHETLEEVIRAYAAFEDESACSISEAMIGEIVTDAKADADLAECVAEYSLGA